VEHSEHRPSIGILLDDLGHSQLAFHAIKSANALTESGEADVSLFFSSGNRSSLQTFCPVFPLVYSVGFKGVLVATSLRTASWLTRVAAPARKLFYCWDLEWTRLAPQDKQYEQLIRVYRSAAYKLVARTPEHATLISQAWNRPVTDVVPECYPLGFLHV
jgi:hypothetical protein